MDFIYIVRLISLREKSLDDLKTDFEIMKLIHTTWANSTYEDYIKFLTSWHDEKYSFSYEDNAYCENYEIACEKVTNNVCDIADHANNYAAILKVSLNGCYAKSYMTEDDFHIFKYDQDNDNFFEIKDKDSAEAKWMVDKMLGKVG